MQARRLQLGEINVGSAVQACLADAWQQPMDADGLSNRSVGIFDDIRGALQVVG